MSENSAQLDHDLLIRIDAKVGMLINSVQNFELASQADRSKLWSEKASTRELVELATELKYAAPSEQVKDHERRIRLLERYTWIAVGMLAILQIVLRFGWPR